MLLHMNIIEKLLEPYENIFQAEKALGYSHQLLHIWRKNGWIPFKRGKEIEERTKGRITANEVWEAAAKARKH